MTKRVVKFEYGFTNHAPVRMTIQHVEVFFVQQYFSDMGTITYRRQFTGVLDSDGVEIYEGDLLLDGSGVWWLVVFSDNGSFVCCDPNDRDMWVLLDDLDFFVAGNIHNQKG